MHGHFRHTPAIGRPIIVDLLVCSFFEPDLFDKNVPFDNTSPIYLINLFRSRARIKVRFRVALFLVFFAENNKNEHLIFAVYLAKRTHPHDQQQNKITYSRNACE